MSQNSEFDRRPAPLPESIVSDQSLPDALRFTKMEGLGNDYVYVEEFDAPIARPGPLALRMSDRNFGVGGDGLVLIGPSSKADFRMRMFNADGSEGEMCGNASRCVARYLYDHGFTKKDEISLETLAGIRILRLTLEKGQVSLVTVDMGAPRLAPEEIPMLAQGENFIDREITVDGKVWKGTALSMGNPHLVLPLPADAGGLMALDLPAIGPKFEHHELFPRRVNTEFIEVKSPELVRMRVWERGSGETLACGTGACAVLVACALNGWTGRKAAIELRGGRLLIEWTAQGAVLMSGPATEVFSGEFKIR